MGLARSVHAIVNNPHRSRVWKIVDLTVIAAVWLAFAAAVIAWVRQGAAQSWAVPARLLLIVALVATSSSWYEATTLSRREAQRIQEELHGVSVQPPAAPDGTDLYEVLGVPPGATADQLRTAYRDKSRKFHPDRWRDQTEFFQHAATTKMAMVNEAWSVLNDPARRREYDFLHPHGSGELLVAGNATSVARHSGTWRTGIIGNYPWLPSALNIAFGIAVVALCIYWFGA